MPPEDQQELRKHIVSILSTNPETRQKTAASMASFEWLKAYTLALLDRHKTEDFDDLLTRLIEAEIDGDKLLDREIRLRLHSGTQRTFR